MAVNQEFWIVATGCSKEKANFGEEKDALHEKLKSHSALGGGGGWSEAGPWKFPVPDGNKDLTFGSFDNLIKLTDDLHKYDGQVDTILHRLERQFIELDPKAEFKILERRMERPLLDWLKGWSWDEAKYPRTRSIQYNVNILMSVVNKLDEEARNKTAQYNDFKTQRTNLAKKDGAMLTNRDLVDVLTPDVVKMTDQSADNDFIYTEHLTTVAVIIPRGYAEEFQNSYVSFAEKVVPMSARRFSQLDDKEGNSLWRVVMMKSAAEPFKKACRERRYITRDFEYSAEGYNKLVAQRQQLDEAVKRQHELVRGLYQAAWSDTMVAWVHVKAMRVFVESVLRYGLPPRFAAFVIAPKPNNAAAARKALADVLGKPGSAGPGGKLGDAKEDEGEEYQPYVSFSFTPFNVPR